MKCEECLPRIEEYVDGELDGRMMERVTSHLSTCAACANELASLQREQEIYANYQRDIAVTPAQWHIVQARIEQEKDNRSPEPPHTRLRERLGELFGARKQFRPAFAAALVLLVIGVTAGVIYLNSRRPQDSIVSGPSKPSDSNLPIGAAGELPSARSNAGNQSIVEDKKPEKNNSTQQTPAVARNRAGIAGQKKNMAVAVNTPRYQKPWELISRTPGIFGDGKAGTDGIARIHSVSDRALNRRLRIVDIKESSARGSNFTPLYPDLDFDSEISRHADRAQLLLRSFRNVRLPANNRALDVSYEKENARKLLYQNIALRRDADSRGDQPATEVLNTLEPILLDIANLPNRAKARDVRSIEQHMKKKEIIATLQVRTLVASN